jgi:formamidopyrimidine-DNA glycosylase
MPELPEVETVRRGLAPVMEGARIVRLEQRRADLRRPFPERFAERLAGRTIQRLERRAKYLLATLDAGETLLMHLGMSGSFTVVAKGGAAGPPGTHDHVVLHLADGTSIRYCDPRRFGCMLLMPSEAVGSHPLLAGLGVEPLGSGFNAGLLAAKAVGRRTPLKAFLLDQKVIAGLGNIYVCEALHRARLSPLKEARLLARRDARPTAGCERLAVAVREVLLEAIEAGGSSLRDHHQTDGTLGYFQHHFRVYDREGRPCPHADCGGGIRRIAQSGRSTFYCPDCQR